MYLLLYLQRLYQNPRRTCPLKGKILIINMIKQDPVPNGLKPFSGLLNMYACFFKKNTQSKLFL